MNTSWEDFMNKWVTDHYRFYLILCDGQPRHNAITPTSFPRTLAQFEKLNDTSECGPHTMMCRDNYTVRGPWGPVTSDDPQVVSKERYLAEVAKRPCPKCGVSVNENCVNLTQRRRGCEVATSWPHYERIITLENSNTIRSA